MPLTIDPALTLQAEGLGDLFIETQYRNDYGAAPEGWTFVEGQGYDFPKFTDLLEAFTVGAKYLQSTDFGQSILQEWRDERSSYKQEDRSYSTQDFVDDLGYLENFTGRNLTQLMKYYLSPAGVVDGAWLHGNSWTSEDGVWVARTFVPMSFREYDQFLVLTEVATGRSIAVPHNDL